MKPIISLSKHLVSTILLVTAWCNNWLAILLLLSLDTNFTIPMQFLWFYSDFDSIWIHIIRIGYSMLIFIKKEKTGIIIGQK